MSTRSELRTVGSPDLRGLDERLLERHFDPKELAKCWKLDPSTIRRMFQDQPGVLKLGKSNRRDGKRDYVTLRIPQSVAERVYQEGCQ